MYGNQCTRPYFMSCLKLQEEFLSKGIDHSWLTTGNESLITRARNTSVATFMKTDFQFLMFIDADIEFEPEDVAKLWNIDAPVKCAAYSMKRPDKPLAAWLDGKIVELKGDEGLLKVDYCGTGFLMIHRSVFEKMQEAYPELEHVEGHVGTCFGYFDLMYLGEGKEKTSLSEDYAFCERWRKLDGEIIMDSSIKLGHHGQYCYRG